MVTLVVTENADSTQDQKAAVELGSTPKEHLHQAVILLEAASDLVESGSPHFLQMRALRAVVRIELARNGIAPIENLAGAIADCDQIIEGSRYPSPIAGNALLAKAQAMQLKSHQGLASPDLYDTALLACQNARDCIDMLRDPLNASQSLATEAGLRLLMAESGIDPVGNSTLAVKITEDCEQLLADYPSLIPSLWLDRAVGIRLLAEWNSADPSNALSQSVELSRRVCNSREPDHPQVGSALLNEASCAFHLAQRGISPVENLQLALTLLGRASKSSSSQARFVVALTTTESTIRKQLAEHGVEPVQNLREAINRCSECVQRLPSRNVYRDVIYIGQAAAHIRLAQFGIDPIANLKAGLFLYSECREDAESRIRKKVRLDSSIAMRKLALLGIDRENNLSAARRTIFELLEETEREHVGNPVLRDIRRQALTELANAYAASAAFADSAARTEELKTAIDYAHAAQQESQSQFDRAGMLLNEAFFHLFLARDGSEPMAHAAEASRLAETAGKAFGHGTPRWATCQTILADAHRINGNLREAFRCLEESIRALDSNRNQIRDEKDRIAFSETIFRHFETIVRTSLDIADAEHDLSIKAEWTAISWHWVHQAKARSFLELLERNPSAFRPRLNDSVVPLPDVVIESLRHLAGTITGVKALLIEFFVFGTDQIAAFILPVWANEPVRCVRFQVDACVVESLCLRILRGAERDVSREDDFDSLPGDLRTCVEPLAALFDSLQPDHVIFAPHFFLNLLPLHAAHLNDRPIIDRFSVSYLPSAAVAYYLRFGAESVQTAGSLIVGNPTGDLLFTASESIRVAAILRSSGIDAAPLLHAEATAEGVRSRVGNAAIIHLACHAALEQDFDRSGFEMHDRRITAAEIMNEWNLPSASLAFLSTCVSGLTITGSSDDYAALSKVFFHAGVPTIIANLWAVNEAPGECFANNFYRGWIVEGLPLAVAFRQAMLVTRELYPRPCHWASFVLLGIPDPPRPSRAD